MKRFAVILIIAVLALGCVFAGTATGSTVNNVDEVSGGTNNEKFVVKTKIGTIYPVYQIVGTGKSSATVTSSTDATEVEGIVSAVGDREYLSISVALEHFGVSDNDLDNRSNKVNIRYKGGVNVTIEASTLKNQYEKNGVKIITDTDGHIYESEAAVVGATAWTAGSFAADKDNFTCAKSAGGDGNTVTFLATYVNGKKVATGNATVQIASGSFKWDITDLTAGDTYKADITVTYTAN